MKRYQQSTNGEFTSDGRQIIIDFSGYTNANSLDGSGTTQISDKLWNYKKYNAPSATSQDSDYIDICNIYFGNYDNYEFYRSDYYTFNLRDLKKKHDNYFQFKTDDGIVYHRTPEETYLDPRYKIGTVYLFGYFLICEGKFNLPDYPYRNAPLIKFAYSSNADEINNNRIQINSAKINGYDKKLNKNVVNRNLNTYYSYTSSNSSSETTYDINCCNLTPEELQTDVEIQPAIQMTPANSDFDTIKAYYPYDYSNTKISTVGIKLNKYVCATSINDTSYLSKIKELTINNKIYTLYFSYISLVGE